MKEGPLKAVMPHRPTKKFLLTSDLVSPREMPAQRFPGEDGELPFTKDVDIFKQHYETRKGEFVK